MKKILLSAAALIAGTATPALAQVDAANPFTGLRAQVHAGLDSTSAAVYDVRTFGDRGTFGGGGSDSQANYGGDVGYDFQTGGSFVFGAYAGINGSSNDVDSTLGLTFQSRRNITVGVRAGVAVSNNAALLYVKGGYSNSDLSVQFTTATAATQALFTNYSSSRSGYHVGGGVEVPIAGRVYLLVDYTYNRYNSFNLDANNQLRFRRHELVGGLGIRF